LNRIASQGRRQLSNGIVEATICMFLFLVAGFIWYFYVMAPRRVDDDGLSHFGVPVTVLLVTYVLPHIVTWLLGLLACLHLIHYAHYVRGSIYKKLLRDLYQGIMVVYGCTYLIQILYVSNISGKRLTLGLVPVMTALVGLVLGYLLIYRGAEKLHKLERR
jgi:hypothetical protein